ncbi:RNase P/RNase MRP subunit p29 [Metallosphaera yellowstonensis MK1]|uniref:Ribonuclease P protein component 1 n=1 Tax=Metallosphaera yellowstonensis MK1 TaxID=671065 RepID=H2C6J4_9CREN|nr:ribonuclease P protein subunit [Metallosphaera yellowstonensis]EHP69421.1 RNase P/RNase MRP subunit p29 [Metallosphaera yellowstonensis MK1]
MRKKLQGHLDLIGAYAKVITHTDPSLVGLSGEVFLETEKTLVLLTKGRKVSVLKVNGTFELDFKRGRITICGEVLVGKPIKRLK